MKMTSQIITLLKKKIFFLLLFCLIGVIDMICIIEIENDNCAPSYKCLMSGWKTIL
jgi:hypothetical protein